MQPAEPDEPALTARTAEFERLFDRAAPTLFAWARLRVSAVLRGRIEAEDIVQEVWVRALTNFASVDGRPAVFRAWLLGIARNVVLEAIEHDKRERRSTPLGSSQWSLSKVPDQATAVSRRLARDESLTKLVAWIEALPRDDRLLVVLCGMEGKSCAMAGERLGLSSEAATKRWQRLRSRLSEQRAPAEWLV